MHRVLDYDVLGAAFVNAGYRHVFTQSAQVRIVSPLIDIYH